MPQGIFAGYAGEHRPLYSYAGFVALFNALFAGFLLLTRRGDRRLPDHFGLGDLLLLTVATHKLSRLLAKDWVTSFLRAPFVTYQGESRPGEVTEQPRGTGLRLALGELLTCPYCLGQWVAAGFAYAAVLSPRPTRFAAAVFSVLTGSDFLHKAYEVASAKSEQITG